MSDSSALESRRRRRLSLAFRREELEGLKLAVQARFAAMVVIALWEAATGRYPAAFYVLGVTALFALLGLAQLALGRTRTYAPWVKYAFAALDVVLLTCVLLLPNPLDPHIWPQVIAFRLDNFVFFFVLMVGTALSYSPWLVLWFGLATAGAWGLGVFIMVAQPDVLTWADLPRDPPPTPAQELALFLDANFVAVRHRLQEIVVVLVVAGLLAVVVGRSRLLVRRQAEAERQRGNLARYFSPNMVDELAHMDRPLGAVRGQKVVVLFADIVGFTRAAEAMTPEAVIAMLRDFHHRMASAVFAHGGTVDKFIGDAIMATFGTPQVGDRDASNALACLRTMLNSLTDWNLERRRAGEAPLRVGIGAHYGPVVLGDIGSERRLEFAVLGDTVNVASRLENLTRELQVDLVISDELAGQARAEGGDGVLDGFLQGAPQKLRNRNKQLAIWTWRGAPGGPA